MEEDSKNLTDKQEKYCQAYVICANQSTAYRIAYNAEDMNSNTIAVKACELHANGNVSVRIKQIQKEVYERNKITIDELVQDLAGMVRFDIADMYDEDGNMLPIKQMPLPVRQMIQQLETDEIYVTIDGKKEVIGHTKKVRTIPKLDAVEKLMKHLGGYEKDNFQKKAEINVVSSMTTEELVQRAQAIKEINGTA